MSFRFSKLKDECSYKKHCNDENKKKSRNIMETSKAIAAIEPMRDINNNTKHREGGGGAGGGVGRGINKTE